MAKFKAMVIMAIFAISLTVGPVNFASAQSASKSNAIDITSPEGADALQGALGQIFGMFRSFGASGEILGEVFQMMFTNFVNMSATKKVDGVYALNASLITNKTSQTYQYGAGKKRTYEPWGVYNLLNATNQQYKNQYPYFVATETGTVTYNQTEGASITFIIWDSDNTLIDAIDKLINAVQNLQRIQGRIQAQGGEASNKDQQEAINTLVEAVTYFLIHINDIITGDEVIILNIIAFTNYVSDISTAISGQWYVTENGRKTNRVTLESVYPNYRNDWLPKAQALNDSTMLYVLNNQFNQSKIENYTKFSFDLIEIWLKHFEVHIDVNAILTAVQNAQTAAQTGQQINSNQGILGDKTLTDVFEGLDIEFYILTHHFQNWYLYDDAKYDDPMYDASIRAKANNGVPDIIFETTGTYENKTVERIKESEVTDYILFRGGDWKFIEPTYNVVNKTMDWGVRAENLKVRIIPMGMSDGETSLTDSPIETMEYMEMGFSFRPWTQYKVNAGDYINSEQTMTLGMAKVKLLQSFGKWNNGLGMKTPRVIGKNLDLATVYMSTVLHVHLLIENKEIAKTPEEATEELLSANNYSNQTHSIKVGDVQQERPLADIDIAGPEYSQYATNGVEHKYQAKSTIIPVVFATWEGQGSQTYTQSDNSTGAMSGILTVEFSVLLYAVSYYSFDSSGNELIHDPTFSIFINIENPGVMAIILVVGVVALVGIAAVMITKKKNATA